MADVPDPHSPGRTDRPALKSADELGVALRRLIGVEEPLLNRVPGERHRYTGLALVVIGTASIAAFSMWNFVGEVFGGATLLALLPAIWWGLFIGNLDAWLVSSLHGTRWRQRAAAVVLPRLLLAVLLGFLIAEPLVLRAFQTAVETEIRDDRKGIVDRYEARLRACNPLDGRPPPVSVGNCRAERIVVPGVVSPTAIADQITDLRQQARRLQNRANADANQLRKLNDTARRECNGTNGEGLTGDFGVGPNCLTNRHEADEFARTARTDELTAQIVAINQRIQLLVARRTGTAEDYERGLTRAIQKRVDERRAQFQEIGLLERIDALHRIVDENLTLTIALWLLRFVFVVIDCLPLIVKLASGSTAYDRLLDRELESVERTFEEEIRAGERRVTVPLERERYELERRLLYDKEELDSTLRLKTAQRNVEIDAAIDELAERLLRNGGPLDRDAAPRPPDPDADLTGPRAPV